MVRARIPALAATLLFAATSAVAVAAPAQAATGYARCPAGNFCVFTGTGGSGTMAQFTNGDVNLNQAPGPSGMSNNISSYRNRGTGFCWGLWNEPNYNGTGRTVPIGNGDVSGNLPAVIDNNVESLSRGYCP